MGIQTITRFFALHAGILPAALIGLVVGHFIFFKTWYSCQRTTPQERFVFLADQILKDGVACMAVLL